MKTTIRVICCLLTSVFIVSCNGRQPLPTPTLTATETSTPVPTLMPSATQTPIPTDTPTLLPQVTIQVSEEKLYCSTRNEQARNYYNDAHNLQDQGELQLAVQSYTKAIELDPQYCDAMDNLGRLLRSQGDVNGAIAWYKKSIAIMPSDKVAHQNLGVAYSILGKIDDAIQEYKILVQLDANDPEGYYGLGSIYLGLNQPEQALAQFKKAEELYKQQASPYVVDAQYALGLSYFAVEDCRNARDYLELIYPQNENDPKVNYFLGSCYLTPELKNLELARKYLHKAQELGVEIPADQLQMINP